MSCLRHNCQQINNQKQTKPKPRPKAKPSTTVGGRPDKTRQNPHAKLKLTLHCLFLIGSLMLLFLWVAKGWHLA